MDNQSILKDLLTAKQRLTQIQEEIKEAKSTVEVKEKKWEDMKNNLKSVQSKKENIVTINVGGEVFMINKALLLSIKGSLFEYIVNSGEFDLSNEIFIDRDPRFFNIFIDYMNGEEVDYSLFKSKQDITLFKREVEFYHLHEINNYINGRMKQVEIVDFSISEPYIHNGVTVGENNLEHINNPDCMHGICTSAPGWIVFQLNELVEIASIEIGGYRGNASLWLPENGYAADIFTSEDQVKWFCAGSIPSGIGFQNKIVTINSGHFKYIMLKSTTNIGIGYLRLNKKDSVFNR